MNLGLRTPVELKTTLSRAEVIDRLSRSIDEPGWYFGWLGAFGTVGRVGTEHCWFENGSFFRRNNRRLTLNFRDAEGGTLLEGAFAIPRFQLFPLFGVFGIVLFICAVSLIGFASTPARWSVSGLLLSISPGGIILFAFLILKFNLWIGRRNESELLEFLEEVLKVPPRWGRDGAAGPVPGGIVIRPKVREPRVWNQSL